MIAGVVTRALRVSITWRAAVGLLVVLSALGLVSSCSDQERAANVSVLGARGDGPLPVATRVPQVVSRVDGSVALVEPTPTPAPIVVPTPTPLPTVEPEQVDFDIPDSVESDRLASSNADPIGLVEAYLNFRLRDVVLQVGGAQVTVTPGESDVAHVVPWQASSRRGDASGVVLVRSSGPDDFWVSEALADGLELGDLSLTVGAGTNELQGFVRSDSPFALELFTVAPGGERVAAPIDESVGQFEIQREAAPGAWFWLRVTDDSSEPLHVTELTTFHDAQSVEQTSTLQMFRNESVEQWLLRFGGGPSQLDAQAAERGVAPAIAALPLSSRLDLGAGAGLASPSAEVGRNDRWVVSRLPFEVEQELRNSGSVLEPGPLYELLRLAGGETQPLSLTDSVSLGGLRPSWMQASASATYVGRSAGPESFVIRIDAGTGEAVTLAGSDVQPAIPAGWSVASQEQLDLIASLDEDNLDLSIIDHLLTLPPLR